MSNCKVVSIINWKGGVGKTTIAHHLAAGLQDENISSQIKQYLGKDRFPKVLLIDTDPQCNLSISCLDYNNFERKVYVDKIPTMKELLRDSLDGKEFDINSFVLKKSVNSNRGYIYNYIDLIPSHSDLIYIDMEISKHHKTNSSGSSLISNISDIYKFTFIHQILEKIRSNYDFIFIDCPPNLNYITQNALYESDLYIIPTIPDRLSSYGILSITAKVKELNKEFKNTNPDYISTKLLGIVLNNVREYRKSPKYTQTNIISALKTKFPNEIFNNYITYGDGIAKASYLGYPVFSLKGKLSNATKQSDQIENITKEFLERISLEEEK